MRVLAIDVLSSVTKERQSTHKQSSVWIRCGSWNKEEGER
jgi:hypothetical protein